MNNSTKKRGRPKKTNPHLHDYMDVTEAASYLKISVSHLYTLTSTKRIPYIKMLGKKLLFDRKEIKDWLNAKKVDEVVGG